MKKLYTTLIALSFMLVAGIVQAASVAKFAVTVKPNTFKVGEAVDVQVQALDANGQVVKTTETLIYMKIKDTTKISQDEYTLPGTGIYTFEPSDQGDKTFSKGLSIQKPGTYSFYVEDMSNSTISGEASVTVTDTNTNQNAVQISIVSPSSNVTLTKDTTTIVGTSSSPNTPITVTLNGTVVDGSFSTDAAGGFSIPLGGLKQGKNTLSLQLKNASGQVLGTSETVEFSVEIDQSPLLKKFTITPATGIVAGDNATIKVEVADRVTSVSLMIDDATYPLQREQDGTYKGNVKFDDDGTYNLKLRLFVNGDMNEVDVDDVTVAKKTTTQTGTATTGDKYFIETIKYTTDPLIPGNVKIERKPKGKKSPFYTIYYGTDPNQLSNDAITSSTGMTLTGLSLNKSTYVQVRPTTQDGKRNGEPSDPLVIKFQPAAPKCVVRGIKIRSEKRGSDYYLIWSAVEGATSYTVYRSNNESDTIDDMSVVGTTTVAEYKYPFDPNAKHETYAYYAIQANCEGGTTKPVGGIEKIKTGPVSSVLVVLLLVVGVYMLYRVNIYQEN